VLQIARNRIATSKIKLKRDHCLKQEAGMVENIEY